MNHCRPIPSFPPHHGPLSKSQRLGGHSPSPAPRPIEDLLQLGPLITPTSPHHPLLPDLHCHSKFPRHPVRCIPSSRLRARLCLCDPRHPPALGVQRYPV